MQNVQIEIHGKLLTFAVQVERDEDAGAPWDNEDGHGDVSDWVTRPKRAGELVLASDRNSKRFYDYARAVKKARAEGWDAAPFNTGNETKRQQAAKVARADYEHYKAWCNNLWEYVMVNVTLLDAQGEPTPVTASLDCVETTGGYPEEAARYLAGELVDRMICGEVEKSTFDYLTFAKTGEA